MLMESLCRPENIKNKVNHCHVTILPCNTQYTHMRAFHDMTAPRTASFVFSFLAHTTTYTEYRNLNLSV